MDDLDRLARETMHEHDERTRRESEEMEDRIRFRLFGFRRPTERKLPQ